MFDFLNYQELSDDYYKGLFFILLMVLTFFAADSWLLFKYPEKCRENIKVVDFFISRLRLFIPLVGVTIILNLILSSEKEVDLENIFSNSLLALIIAFYVSKTAFKLLKKKYSLDSLLYVLIIAISSSYLISKYSWSYKALFILLISLLSGCLLYGINKFSKNNVRNNE